MVERSDFQRAGRCYGRNVRAAGPAGNAVHLHGAGTADTHTAGESVGQGRIQMALNVGNHVQHRLAFPAGNLEVLECAFLSSPPDRDFEKAVWLGLPTLQGQALR